MSFSERLKEERKNAGLTQAQLSKKLGITAQSYSQYETGKRNPKMETQQKIADALGIDIDDLCPTKKEMEAIKKAAESVTDKRKLEIEEKRLSNLIERKKKLLNISGKQKTVDYMDDLVGNPKYRKDTE